MPHQGPRVALMAIVKAGDESEAVSLARMLANINPYVDAVYLQLNAPKGKPINPRMRQIASQFTDHIQDYIWTGNFASARNALMETIPKEYGWLLWLDTDDTIDHPELIRPSLAIIPAHINGLLIDYHYQKDEYGNVLVHNWSTRAVRHNGSFVWKSSFDDAEVSVHETLVPRRGSKQLGTEDWHVIHEVEPEHYTASLLRNIDLLKAMAERQAQGEKGIDPRILYYLATHLYDAHDYRESEQYFLVYLQRSGWAEERSEAHVYMGNILLMRKEYQKARNAFLWALGEHHNNPGAYLGLGKLESKEQRWEQAAAWLKDGIAIQRKPTGMVQYNWNWELYTLYAQALSNLGGKNLTEALEMAEAALKLKPFDPASKENRDGILKLIAYRDNLRAVTRVLRLLKEEELEDRILPFTELLPDSLADAPVVVDARQTYTPPKVWPKRSIAIYVGFGPLGIWGPWSLNEGGTGGSEEAVVRLSRELAKLGWQVTVYGMPGHRAGYDIGSPEIDYAQKYKGAKVYGKQYMVEWKHYWEFNQNDTFDVLISWRQPAFFDRKFKARKTYLWLHDVVERDELTSERLANITKVIYVSKYHSERPESDHVPARQKLASGNGITPSDFVRYDGKFTRDPYRCIYASANERGLRILYDIWRDVRKAVPQATLHVYYGWHSFDAVNRDNPERMAWKASMVLKAKELERYGVTQHGRVDQDEHNEAIFQSGLFTYPCIFPEVNCITAQKSMAGGAVPVTSDFAVLPDIVKYGEVVPMHDFQPEDIERYKERLIWWLQHPEEQEKIRRPMMKWARETYSWANTAAQWSEEMKEGA